MTGRALVPLAAAAGCALACALASCSSVPADARIGVVTPDGSEAAFGPVSDFLDHRCGSLDCHGQIGRNLRIWGCEGMRLDPNDLPGICPQGTTPAEHQATFRSLVGLEPTVMSVVVEGHGAHPELLTFVRKARGTEAHKGGQLMMPGDPQDQCITDWLSGQDDQTIQSTCTQALVYVTFPLPDASTE